MRDSLSWDEVEGFFESRKENDDKVSDLKSQIKAISADTSDLTKEFAKDAEIEVKVLKKVYQDWLERQKGESEDDSHDDYYSLLAMLDRAFDEESEKTK